jgi:hypothetical protein
VSQKLIRRRATREINRHEAHMLQIEKHVSVNSIEAASKVWCCCIKGGIIVERSTNVEGMRGLPSMNRTKQ